jgi:hypothetical protein
MEEQQMVTKLTISQMPAVEVLKKDLIIDVDQDGDKLGGFRFSKGSVDFYAKGAKKTHHRVTWKELSELVVGNGKKKG